MFENAFNLKFNLHKAYTDIGIRDENIERLAAVYDLGLDEIESVLEEFHSENAANAAAIMKNYPDFAVSTPKQINIAYIGDSITSDRISHQNIMRCILEPFKNVQVQDFSISGWKVSDVLTAYYPGIASFRPNIAVMMIGTNDMRITDDEFQIKHTSIGEFERDLVYVVKKLNGAGCRVILCTLPPFCMKKMTPALPDWNILYTEEDRRDYDAVIIKTAKENGSILVDMRAEYDRFDSAAITIEDGLHLNSEGQTLLAANVFSKLKELL